MTAADRALLQRAEELGVETRFRDVHGRIIEADPGALAVVVEILAADESDRSGAPLVEPVVLIRDESSTDRTTSSRGNRRIQIGGRLTGAELRLDDGTVLEVASGGAVELPPDLPTGCHALRVEVDGAQGTSTVVCAPPTMTADAAWLGGSGLFVPAYALWDHDRPLPSFELLARLARAIGEVGTDLLTTLPLYATFLDDPFDPSPYAPASRLHWNEVFIDDAALPDAAVPAQGRYLDWATLGERRRDQLLRAVDRLDDPTLDDTTPDDITAAALDRFVSERPDVAEFARFMAERAPHDGQRSDRVRRSHELAQFLADRELSGLPRGADPGEPGLAIDLPIGCHVEGYERWAHPELFAGDVTIGAPPDLFFGDGQDWGLPPQLPAAGRRSGHRLWRDLLRRAGEHAALLRIDHVMAVHRLWWIPAGFGPHQGVYVRYPREELLGVIAATAASIGTTVVGEDLGTVPDEVAEALERWGMLGMYEEQFHTDVTPLPRIPARTVSGIRTHDMQPFAAFVAEQGDALAGYRQRLALDAGVSEIGAGYDDVLDAVLGRLARSPSAMVTVDLDDLVGETEPHNVPGLVQDTTWRRRIDRPLSEVLADPDVRRRLAILDDRDDRDDRDDLDDERG